MAPSSPKRPTLVLDAHAFAAHTGVPTSPVEHWLGIAAMSRRGEQQSVNEDVYLVDPGAALLGAPAAAVTVAAAVENRYHVIAVADGAGAQPAARRAAARAIETVAALATAGSAPRTIGDLVARLHASVEAAHAVVRREGLADPARQNMAAALTAAGFLGGVLAVAHVGHGRAYLYRRGALARLTDDDTLASLPGVVATGGGATVSANKVLLSCVGGALAPDVQIELRPVLPGDVVLLTTDGLTNAVSDASIAHILAAGTSPRGTCEALLDAARGASDDATAVVAQVA